MQSFFEEQSILIETWRLCVVNQRGDFEGIIFLKGTHVDSSRKNVPRTRQVTKNLKKTRDGRCAPVSSMFDQFANCILNSIARVNRTAWIWKYENGSLNYAYQPGNGWSNTRSLWNACWKVHFAWLGQGTLHHLEHETGAGRWQSRIKSRYLERSAQALQAALDLIIVRAGLSRRNENGVVFVFHQSTNRHECNVRRSQKSCEQIQSKLRACVRMRILREVKNAGLTNC